MFAALRSFWTSCGVLRDLEHVPRAQLDREAGRLAGVRQELLGLLDVLLALRDGLVGGRVDGREWAVVAVVRLALEQALDDVVAVDEEGHRLAHALVVERLLVRAHVHLAVLRRAQLDDGEVRIRQERLAVDGRELGEHVDLVALHAEDRGRRLLVELELVAVRQRLALLVPVVGVLRVGHADVRGVLLELPRARALEVLRPGRRVEALGQDDQVVVVRGRVEREVAVRRLELEHHGRRVGGLCAALGEHAGERRQGVGAVVGIGVEVERRRDVLGGHRLAVLELHALANLERPLRPVAVGLPALGEARDRLELAVGVDQELARLPEYGERALVVHLDRVEVRAGGLQTGADRAALLDVGRVDLAAAGAGRVRLAARRARPSARCRRPRRGSSASAATSPRPCPCAGTRAGRCSRTCTRR